MSALSTALVSKALLAWVSGFVFGYTLKTIKVFFEKI